MKLSPKNQLPDILYEDPETGGSPFPFIQVKIDETMPASLFIMEYKLTGEMEPNMRGEEVPITEQIMHHYFDIAVLKEKLSPEKFDEVRLALGLQPMKQAVEAGKEKLDRVATNVEKIREQILKRKEELEKEKTKQ